MRVMEVCMLVTDTQTGTGLGSTLMLDCRGEVISSSVLSMPYLDSSSSFVGTEVHICAVPFCTDSTP